MRLYDHVRVVAPGLTLDRPAALVAAARSSGTTTEFDEELRVARRRLRERESVSVPSLSAAKREFAETEETLAGLRERVATLRGRLQTDNEADGGDDEGPTGKDGVKADYRSAIRALSRAETEHAAAAEALESARERARKARDQREQRLRLEDRVDNLERRARTRILSDVRPLADDVTSSVPGSTAERFEDATPVTAALTLLRIGVVRIPVVLACRRFRDATSAEACLQVPVYRV